MTGIEAYRTYLAVSRHFKSSTYDYFKYNGKVKINPLTYESRRDRYFFEKAARKYDQEEFEKLLVSLYTAKKASTNFWIGDLFSTQTQSVWKEWNKNQQSLTYSFEEDISRLYNSDETFDNLFVSHDGTHPLLFRMYVANKITIDTILILDELVHYTKRWRKNEDVILIETIQYVEKYRNFFYKYNANFDTAKFRKIVLKYYE